VGHPATPVVRPDRTTATGGHPYKRRVDATFWPSGRRRAPHPLTSVDGMPRSSQPTRSQHPDDRAPHRPHGRPHHCPVRITASPARPGCTGVASGELVGGATGRTTGLTAGLSSGVAVRGGALVGGGLALVALSAIWVARVLLDRDVYVSQLGAPSEPTAAVFNTALLVLGIGGVLVAGASHLSAPARASGPASGPAPGAARGRAGGDAGGRTGMARRAVGAWSVSATLGLAGAAFVVASRVTCTDGCPVPLTAGSTVQDLVHVSAAAAGFAAAAWAMLQVGWSRGRVPAGVRRVSRVAAVGVAQCSASGGLLSVAAYRTDVGALLEFAAMSIGVLWLVCFAAWVALNGWASPGRGPMAVHEASTGSGSVQRCGDDRFGALGDAVA